MKTPESKAAMDAELFTLASFFYLNIKILRQKSCSESNAVKTLFSNFFLPSVRRLKFRFRNIRAALLFL